MARMEVKNVKRQWLADIRTNRGKTQLEVARAVGLSQSGYANIEVGLRMPSVETAKRIAAALGFEWIRFFEEPETEDSA